MVKQMAMALEARCAVVVTPGRSVEAAKILRHDDDAVVVTLCWY